jgi:hypothetical protein
MPNAEALTIEAANWLALNEALGHVRHVQNCTPIEAQRYLKAKIGNGIISVKWADSEGANDIPDPRYLQGTKLKLSGTGLAHDKDAEAYRPLLVLRSEVMAAWQHDKSNAEPSKEVENAKYGAPSNKSENDRLPWMTLVDAEEHIEILQKCDSVEALRQLKEEIGDGIVAVKWEDDPTDNPDVKILKTSEFILTGPGFAPDGKEYRQLLVNRANVFRLWPAPDAGATRIAVGGAHRKPYGTASEVSIREAAKKIYGKSDSKQPNVEEAWRLIKKELPNAARSKVREILNEPAFKDLRLKAGNQSRR